MGVFFLLCIGPAWAQSISASLSGTVEDAQSLIVQDAAVEVLSASSGAIWKLASDAEGRFRLPSLPPGGYSVTITKPGFAPFQFESVSLTVGERRSLRAVLQLDSATQQVTVSASGVSIAQTSASDQTNSYDANAMSNLPMLSGSIGRNFRTQVFVSPGVTPSLAAHRPFAVSGARNRNNNYLIDSNDYNEIEGGLLMGRSASEQLISVEAIEGMQVLTHNFKAEHGRQNGSIISIVTKSGTNDWRGGLYEFFRNDALNARNTFDQEKPALRSHQFGGSIGGPIKKNRAFLFGNFESFLRRQARPETIQTLTPQQKAIAAPDVRPLAAMYPDPNIGGTNLYRANSAAPGDLYTFVLRADVDLTPAQRIFSRSTFLTSNNTGGTGASQARYSGDVGSQGHSLHHVWTPAPRAVNEARFNYTRFRILDAFVDPVQLGSPAINGEVGAIFVNGLTSLGHFSFWGRNTAQNNFQYTDDLSLIRGAHSLKLGAAVRRLQLNSGATTTGFIGQLRFNNIADFLAARPATYNKNIGTPYIGQRATEFNAYIQDDWNVSRRLTLNLGLRYEFNSVPTEVNNLIDERYRFASDYNNFAPRFGLAYRIDDSAKTVLRGGYGVYYNVIELSFVGLTRFNPPLIRNYVAVRPNFPNLLANANQTAGGLVIPASGARQPYSQHGNLALERQLWSPRTSLSVSYIATRGLKMPMATRPNGGDAMPPAQRPDPSLGVVNYLETSANSRYDALQTSFQIQQSGLMVRTSYTWSKFLDAVSDFPSSNQRIEAGLLMLDEHNRRLNYGRSDFDIRHNLQLAYSYNLPLARGNRWLGGWTLGGITTLLSGRPFTLYSGTDNLEGTNNNRILDVPGALIRGQDGAASLSLSPGVSRAQLTPAPGTLGAIGRNTESGDRLVEINVSAAKNFNITERWSLQFRAEGFNIANTANYGPPEGLLPSVNFGRALTAFDSRQIQLALRLSF
jgi:hypothetical protein